MNNNVWETYRKTLEQYKTYWKNMGIMQKNTGDIQEQCLDNTHNAFWNIWKCNIFNREKTMSNT